MVNRAAAGSLSRRTFFGIGEAQQLEGKIMAAPGARGQPGGVDILMKTGLFFGFLSSGQDGQWPS
jgi:hypothetical protein